MQSFHCSNLQQLHPREETQGLQSRVAQLSRKFSEETDAVDKILDWKLQPHLPRFGLVRATSPYSKALETYMGDSCRIVTVSEAGTIFFKFLVFAQY